MVTSPLCLMWLHQHLQLSCCQEAAKKVAIYRLSTALLIVG
jgi:hypothetical protein